MEQGSSNSIVYKLKTRPLLRSEDEIMKRKASFSYRIDYLFLGVALLRTTATLDIRPTKQSGES